MLCSDVQDYARRPGMCGACRSSNCILRQRRAYSGTWNDGALLNAEAAEALLAERSPARGRSSFPRSLPSTPAGAQDADTSPPASTGMSQPAELTPGLIPCQLRSFTRAQWSAPCNQWSAPCPQCSAPCPQCSAPCHSCVLPSALPLVLSVLPLVLSALPLVIAVSCPVS